MVKQPASVVDKKTSYRPSVTGQIHQHHQYNADSGLTGHRFVYFSKDPKHLTFPCIYLADRHIYLDLSMTMCRVETKEQPNKDIQWGLKV